jgi:hypothetical protein
MHHTTSFGVEQQSGFSVPNSKPFISLLHHRAIDRGVVRKINRKPFFSYAISVLDVYGDAFGISGAVGALDVKCVERAMQIRNKLTHPTKEIHLVVSDDDLLCVFNAFTELTRVFLAIVAQHCCTDVVPVPKMTSLPWQK